MAMTREISTGLGCLDCPFYFVAEEGCDECEELLCYHPVWSNRRAYESRRIRRDEIRKAPRLPKWCPLKTHPVLVTLAARKR
jgi:hypothetical protein